MRKKYLVLALGFILITAPGAIAAWLSLFERFFGEDKQVTVTFGNWYQALFPILGLLVLLFGIWWTRPSKGIKSVTLEDSNKRTESTEHSIVTQEHIAERLSFIQQLRATEDQLVKKVHFNIEGSAAHYFAKFCEESDVRTIVQSDNMASTAVRLIAERFSNLTFQCLEHQARGQKLTPSTITDDDIRNECNRISQVVREYRNLVDEWMKFTEDLAKKEVPTFWNQSPWSVNIHRNLADAYDELMTLVKNLRNATPRTFQSLLPKDEQITRFPRATLLS